MRTVYRAMGRAPAQAHADSTHRAIALCSESRPAGSARVSAAAIAGRTLELGASLRYNARHGRRILSLRRGHDLRGRRSARAHVLQLLDLPPDRRAVVVLLADPGPGRRPDGDLPVGRQVARSPSLRALRLHHALVAARSGARSHGRQRAPDGARDRRGGAGPTVRRRRYVDVPRVAPQLSSGRLWSLSDTPTVALRIPRLRSLDRERRPVRDARCWRPIAQPR